MREQGSNVQCPIIDPVKLGKRMRKLCKRQNITATELRDYLHLCSDQAVYLWFSGKRIPNPDNLKAICRYLGERVDDLINSERAEQAERVLRDDLLSSQGKRVLLYCMRLQKN